MDTTVGYILLGSALVPAAAGYRLSLIGLKEVNAAATVATKAGKETTQLVKAAQAVVATSKDGEATLVANSNKAALDKTDELTNAVGGVEESLKELTGVFAPARVFLALALLLVVASFFPLGVISLSAGSGSSSTTSPAATAK